MQQDQLDARRGMENQIQDLQRQLNDMHMRESAKDEKLSTTIRELNTYRTKWDAMQNLFTGKS